MEKILSTRQLVKIFRKVYPYFSLTPKLFMHFHDLNSGTQGVLVEINPT